MNDFLTFLAEENIRLETCIKEPIRTPGAIQPHGVLFATDPATFIIEYVSDNTELVSAHSAHELLGASLSLVVGDDAIAAIAAVLARGDVVIEPILLALNGGHFDVIVSRAGELAVIEFEPAMSPQEAISMSGLYAAMHSWTRLTSKQELWDQAALELRNLLDFDRVMVYYFHPDEHGEVVAESRAADMEPYKGLHYPASDIPAQARQLYLTKLSRLIADSSRVGTELLSSTDVRLDLSAAELRAVSPHHLEFMKNMGQASTFSLSLIREGRLIGMITCAHREPRRLPYRIRKALEITASQIAMQLGNMDDIDRFERLGGSRSVRDQLVAGFGASGDVDGSFIRGDVSLLSLIAADVAAISISGGLHARGSGVDDSSIPAFARQALAASEGATFVSDALATEHPELAALVPGAAGAIIVPIGSNGDYLAWFRGEVAQTVTWLGDLSTSNRETTLSPRTSFSSWSQSVTGQSLSWGGLEAEAAQLGLEIERAMQRRVDATLAVFALYDPLTQLPNRRLLMERLEGALSVVGRRGGVSLLFLDLDGFKAINDTYGHEAGDSLLVHTAQQLQQAVREDDTVARLGGDEFVILCENTTPRDADQVATRIGQLLSLPFMIGGDPIQVGASIGLVQANPSYNAAELLREADAAMYRAKINGRGRYSR